MDDRNAGGQARAQAVPGQRRTEVADLAAIISHNAELSQSLKDSLLVWTYLREVLQGEAPPPVLAFEVPRPGDPGGPLLVQKDLGVLDLGMLSQIFLPIITHEGEQIINGCYHQADIGQRLAVIAQELTTQRQQEQAPPPEPVPAPQPAQTPKQQVLRPGALSRAMGQGVAQPTSQAVQFDPRQTGQGES